MLTNLIKKMKKENYVSLSEKYSVVQVRNTFNKLFGLALDIQGDEFYDVEYFKARIQIQIPQDIVKDCLEFMVTIGYFVKDKNENYAVPDSIIRLDNNTGEY